MSAPYAGWFRHFSKMWRVNTLIKYISTKGMCTVETFVQWKEEVIVFSWLATSYIWNMLKKYRTPQQVLRNSINYLDHQRFSVMSLSHKTVVTFIHRPMAGSICIYCQWLVCINIIQATNTNALQAKFNNNIKTEQRFERRRFRLVLRGTTMLITTCRGISSL